MTQNQKLSLSNYKRAAELYEQECTSGNHSSCYGIAILYDKGNGVVQNDKTAFSFFLKSFGMQKKVCDGGNAKECSGVGHSYEFGQGVAQRKEKAAKYFRMACDNGDAFGCKKNRIKTNNYEQFFQLLISG
ncbi:hypothetical protein A9Q83_04600 [Alphaproteobacteria bacterium 46_93_T64]|nr:hypothetical protein A9Q83_04600 [Alphaproteobacteria bacterium 46_93_T64]